jgi:hypothetical protein
MRHSNLALVTAKLRIDTIDYLLLNWHLKWSDWSLVGGHIEPGEEHDWGAAAVREANEELAPLHSSRDFSISELTPYSVTWGPTDSRSKGEPTLYTAKYFMLSFVVDPAKALAKLSSAEFLLLDSACQPTRASIGETLRQLHQHLPSGFADIPLSWPRSLRSSEVTIPRVGSIPLLCAASHA